MVVEVNAGHRAGIPTGLGVMAVGAAYEAEAVSHCQCILGRRAAAANHGSAAGLIGLERAPILRYLKYSLVCRIVPVPVLHPPVLNSRPRKLR